MGRYMAQCPITYTKKGRRIMANERKGEIAPGYKPLTIFGHPFTVDGRQIYHHAGRGEYSMEHDYADMALLGLTKRARIIVEHAVQWAKEGECSQ